MVTVLFKYQRPSWISLPLDTNTSIIIIITIVIIVFITIKLIIDLRQHPRQSASCSSKVKDVEGYDVLVAALLNQVILQLRWEFQFIFEEMLRGKPLNRFDVLSERFWKFFCLHFHRRETPQRLLSMWKLLVLLLRSLEKMELEVIAEEFVGVNWTEFIQ